MGKHCKQAYLQGLTEEKRYWTLHIFRENDMYSYLKASDLMQRLSNPTESETVLSNMITNFNSPIIQRQSAVLERH